MRKTGKIHFVHHLEKRHVPANLGDWICCPYYYFPDFFGKYTCLIHSDWAILWHEIERDDVVVFGGGGLLDNSDELNAVLNRLLECCDNVIIWGAGTHKYNQDNIFGKKTASVPIQFDRAVLVGIRDYKHPSNLPYLPCVSCLNDAFSSQPEDSEIKRNVGTIKSALEKTFAVSNTPSFVTNAEPIGSVANYIRSSNIILVSSYHGAFWSMLLGRKAILPSSRLGVDKYKYFRHPVGFYDKSVFDEQQLMSIASDIPDIPNFLEESRDLTSAFFTKCREFIEDRLGAGSQDETLQIISKRNAQLEFTVIDMWNEIRRLNGRLTTLEKLK
ncbi:hypothetical protein [Roseibium album]|uniref:hypothetical protein n=1 Tax=Roseibium album TaxID=311410 RepID=UPI00391916D3